MLRILCINFGNPQPQAKEFWTNSLSYSRSHPLDKLVVGEYHDISLMCETALDTIVHESTALSYTTVKYHVTHSSQSDRNIIYQSYISYIQYLILSCGISNLFHLQYVVYVKYTFLNLLYCSVIYPHQSIYHNLHISQYSLYISDLVHPMHNVYLFTYLHIIESSCATQTAKRVVLLHIPLTDIISSQLGKRIVMSCYVGKRFKQIKERPLVAVWCHQTFIVGDSYY